jgi:hypothetical protein
LLGFERLVVAYFAALAIASIPARVHRSKRRLAFVLSIVFAGLAILMSREAPSAVRSLVPAVYLVAGYWVPALLVPTLVRPWFGIWLRRSDTDWPWPTVSWPRWALASFEAAYLMCFAVVATGFAIVWIRGGEVEVSRFWFAVLTAGFLCYMTLPWLVSRPPRLLDDVPVAAGSVAALNRLVLRRVTHEFNTFPSGHVAVAAAAALSTLSVSWPAALVLGIVAMGVGLGAVTGGYHYRIDVALAVAVAIGATSWSRFL